MIRIIRLSPRSLTICFCSVPENSIEVTPSKSEESKVCQKVWINLLYLYAYESMADNDWLKQD